MPKAEFSRAEARRIALAAQGFAGSQPERTPNATRMLGVVRRIGVVQIDSVNVLVRSQYLPLFSRLGSYDRTRFDELAYHKNRRLFEYWAHEASLVPIETYPHLRWRMDRARVGEGTWGRVARVAREAPRLIAEVENQIRARGPLTAGELEGARRGAGGWWGWSDHKVAVEYLFWAGVISTERRRNFERVYDLTERVIPAELLEARFPVAEQQRQLMQIAARAHGIATERDLRDYFRLSVEDGRARLDELVEEGTLLPVRIDELKERYYLWHEARIPRAVKAAALLSPFDSIVWERVRTDRLFDFHFRLEIYTPAHKRVHGYYVLPFLLGDRLVARVDLKSDRATSRLLVRSVHLERAVRAREVIPALRAELQRLAEWLDLDRLVGRLT